MKQDKGSNSCRVPIKSVPKWKVAAIAQYKAEKAARQASRVHAQSSANPIPSLNSANSAHAAKQLRSEIEGLEKNSVIIANEMKCLTSIKLSLHWLLEKATLFETQRNHESVVE